MKVHPQHHALMLACVLTCAQPFAAFAKPAAPLPFEGSWRSCFTLRDGTGSAYDGHKICTGYDLVQRGQNVCGTWSEFATGIYEGRLQAVATDKTHAQWTSICGRTGSETNTECQTSEDEGAPQAWEAINQPLQLCKGRLLVGNDSCTVQHAKQGYRKHHLSHAQRTELLAEPWMQQCLSRTP